jgi:transposase
MKGEAKGEPVMREITFSEAEVQAIGYERYHHPNPRVQRHMEILCLKHHADAYSLSHDDIANLAGCSRSTVQRTLLAYHQGGLESIRQVATKESSSELDDHRVCLEEIFKEHSPRSVKQARHTIFEHTGICRGLTQVRHFLHRLGLKPRKVAAIPIPPKSTLEEHVKTQAEFREKQLEPRLEEARQRRRQVLFVDAVHFVHASLLGVIWCLARLCIRAASGRKRYNVLAALDAVSHRLIQVSNHSYINAESVCLLLRAVAAAATPGLPITLVLDNARYQKCALVQDLARQLGIELLYLPSYSPNLNLIERVWKFVKAECLRSTYYANYEEFHTAIQQCLDDLPSKHKAAMDSLLTLNFQTFENVSLVAA